MISRWIVYWMVAFSMYKVIVLDRFWKFGWYYILSNCQCYSPYPFKLRSGQLIIRPFHDIYLLHGFCDFAWGFFFLKSSTNSIYYIKLTSCLGFTLYFVYVCAWSSLSILMAWFCSYTTDMLSIRIHEWLRIIEIIGN